jgi:hypothetical protein
MRPNDGKPNFGPAWAGRTEIENLLPDGDGKTAAAGEGKRKWAKAGKTTDEGETGR